MAKELATVISRFDPATEAIDSSQPLPDNTDDQPEVGQIPPSPEPTEQTPQSDLELPASPTEQPLPFPTQFLPLQSQTQQPTPQLEFSFEVDDLTSMNISVDRIISDYLTSPPSRTDNDKTSELVDLLKEVRSQNKTIIRKLDEFLNAEREHPRVPARPLHNLPGPTRQLFYPPAYASTDSNHPTQQHKLSCKCPFRH